MEKIINKINLIWGGFVTLMAGIFGEFWFLFAAFLALNIIDYVSGTLKSRFTKTESSNKGFKGICKKVGYWVIIGVAFFIPMCFIHIGEIAGVNLEFVTLMGWFTLATFIINEIRSVFENLAEIGCDIPSFLIKGLEVIAEKIEKSADDKED